MRTIRLPLMILAAMTIATPLALGAEDQRGPGRKGGRQFGGPGGPGAFFGAGLTEEERTKMAAAREKALAEQPSLRTEAEEAWAKLRELQEKLSAAMIKADPSVAPIIEKQKAAMRERFGGRPGPGKAKSDAAPSGGAGGAFSDESKAPKPKKPEAQ